MKKVLLHLQILVVALVVLVCGPQFVFAQGNVNNPPSNNEPSTNAPTGYQGENDPTPKIIVPIRGINHGEGNLVQLMGRLITYLLSIIALAAIVIIIVAGLRMIAGSGSEDQRKKSKQAITWAIIGLILALFAVTIVTIIQRLLQP